METNLTGAENRKIVEPVFSFKRYFSEENVEAGLLAIQLDQLDGYLNL
jgi:hypothetical protein